jgi:hypothetical protein
MSDEAEVTWLPRDDRDALTRIWDDIRTHSLEPYIAELDVKGYTVVPPECAAPQGFTDRLLDACLRVAERRNGEPPDLKTGATHAHFKGRFSAFSGGGDSPIGDLMQSLIFEGEVFEEALMNPVLLTLASYLCGYSVVLSSMGCFVKGPNDTNFALHTDTPMPSPLPPHALVCNCTYILTEFTRDNGATAVVPGSHKLCRGPEPHESDPEKNPNAIAIEAPPGSLLVWHGNTWHGAFRRSSPGLRIQVPVYMARPYVRTQEDLIGRIPEEMLERHPPRFGWLTQQGISYGYASQDDSIARAARAAPWQKVIVDLAGKPGGLHG